MSAATLYKAAGGSTEITPQTGPTFSLLELQTYVGGYIEPVWLPDNRVMIVNEEGRLQELPLNRTASAIAQRWIVGDVVVCDRAMME